MVRSPRLVPLLGLIVAVACNEKPIDESAGGTDSATDATAATEATAATDPTGGEGTTAVEFEPIPARGIYIERVQSNQAVGVDIARDGAFLPGSERGSYLLANRLMLFRGFWKVEEGWEPRPIRAVFTVYYSDGTTRVQEQTLMIEDESFEGDLARTFYFGLEAENVSPDIRFDMTLWETQPGQEDRPETEPPPRMPYEGTSLVGVEDSDQLLRVVIVPFNYNNGSNCNSSPDTSEETMQLFFDYMYMQQPVDKLEIYLHDPVDWNQPLTDFSQLNNYMSSLRFDEGAPPEVFYYGLVDACSGGVNGAGGKAYGIPAIPPRKEHAYQRVSSGLIPKNRQEWAAETFVHEVGHTLGRKHIDCGGAAGWDPTYPFPNGEVGEWGFGIIDFRLKHPTVNKDYMTYCSPTWVGTWAWTKIYPVIKELTAWTKEGAPAPDTDVYGGSLLVGTIYPDGDSTWQTVPGGLSAEELSAGDEIELRAGGEVIATQPAAVIPDPDGDVLRVAVQLPDGFDKVTEFTHRGGDGKERTIAIKDVALSHHKRTIQSDALSRHKLVLRSH